VAHAASLGYRCARCDVGCDADRRCTGAQNASDKKDSGFHTGFKKKVMRSKKCPPR